jgi:hypothetical protein
VVVDDDDGVGLVHPPSAPLPFTVALELKQKLIVVDAPLATAVPLRVTEVVPTELGAFVVTVGAVTAVVKFRTVP